MKMLITVDHNIESGLSDILRELYRAGYDNHVAQNDYGNGLLGLTIVFMCRDPALNFKRRIRFDKKANQLYMDIMLDLDQMKALTHEARRRLVADRLAREVPETVSKYKIPDFDRDRFFNNLKSWLDGLGWA